MPESTLPALSLVAVPGRIAATLELAKEIERRGFSAEEYGSSLSRKQALTQNYQASKQRGIYRK